MTEPFYSVFFLNFMAEPFYSVFSPNFPPCPFIVIAVSNYNTPGGPTLPFYRHNSRHYKLKKKDQKIGTCPFIVNSVFFLRTFMFVWAPFFSNYSALGGSTFSKHSILGGSTPPNYSYKTASRTPSPQK